jgi:DNA-binding response OmpR family regulator
MRHLALVLDADTVERHYVAGIVAADGFHVLQTGTVVEAMTWLVRFEPVVVIMSEEVEDLDLEDVMAILRRITAVPLIVIGGGGTPDEVRSLEGGGDAYLRRPFSAADLLVRARALLRTRDDDEAGMNRAGRQAENAGGGVSVFQEMAQISDWKHPGGQTRRRFA